MRYNNMPILHTEVLLLWYDFQTELKNLDRSFSSTIPLESQIPSPSFFSNSLIYVARLWNILGQNCWRRRFCVLLWKANQYSQEMLSKKLLLNFQKATSQNMMHICYLSIAERDTRNFHVLRQSYLYHFSPCFRFIDRAIHTLLQSGH